MRKTLALSIALLLVASFSLSSIALADNTPYTNPTDGYQIAYPDTWTLLSKDTVSSVMSQLSEGKIEGIDAGVFAAYQAQIEAMDMIVVISDTGMFNFNVIYQALPMEINNELAIAQMCPATVAQFKSAFGDIEVVDSGSIVTVGEKEYVHMAVAYELGGVPMEIQQYFYMAGKKLYVLSFTKTSVGVGAELNMDETVQGILAHFVPGE